MIYKEGNAVAKGIYSLLSYSSAWLCKIETDLDIEKYPVIVLLWQLLVMLTNHTKK